MSDRLTPEREAEIAARAEAATPGPWEAHENYGAHFYAYLGGPYLRGVGTFNFGEGDDAEADKALTVNAREDIRTLLAELAAVRAERDLAQRKVASLKAEQDRDDAEYAAVIAERDSARQALREACDQIAALESDLGGATARIAELEAERLTQNQALDDAVRELRTPYAERARRERHPGRRQAWLMLASAQEAERVADVLLNPKAARAAGKGPQPSVEGEHYEAVHHDYRQGRDLPHAQTAEEAS